MWTIVITFLAVANYQDLYVFTQPTFKTEQQCVSYVTMYSKALEEDALNNSSDVTGVDTIYCVPTDKVKEYIIDNQNFSPATKI